MNLHKAMQYRDGTNPPEPEIRVNVGNGFVISGNVNIPGTVTVNSSPDNPVHTHITEVGTSGNLLADNINYLPIGGNVLAFQGDIPWLVNANITNNLTISSIISNVNVNPITGSVNTTVLLGGTLVSNTNPIPVSGTVTANVTFPTTQQVTIMKNGLPVSDTVALPTRVLNDEALIAYARGAAVTEAEVLNAYLIDKSGATSTLGTTPLTQTTVWSYNGLFPWTTFAGSGDKLYIKSLTDDPKVRNKSIKIEGLDSNYNILIEEVAFGSNTTVAVSTTNNFYRINRIYLTGNNTNNLPQTYDIEVRYGSTSGTIVSYLTAPWARGQNCFYTVPAGYEAFLLSLNGNSGKDDEITSSLWVRTFNGTWELKKSFKFISGLFDHNFRTPLRIPEKSDVEIRAFALVESSSIGTEFQLLVLPKA
jgi:hypothetical protein